ncbi:MAG: hypothetical protein M3042_03000 [Actinomycetota bacterium]|nr:hypothetical protein [Actinomycetota bacterium]
MARWHRRAITLVAAAAAALLAAGGCTAAPRQSSSTKPAAPCRPQPSFDIGNDLSQRVTTVIQAHDRAGFLALAAAPAAKTAMALWWDNVSALGFTTGGLEPELGPTSAGTLRVKIGLHADVDPIDDAAKPPTPMAPSTEYLLHVAGVGPGCKRTVITDWKALSNAPWDGDQKLYVVKTAHVVTAGEPTMRAEITRISGLAEKAAVWDFGFFHFANKDRYVNQSGFVLFVPTTDTQAFGWFRAADAKKPKGWTSDPAAVGGTEFPLAGTQLPPTVKADKLDALSVGGGRTIITATGRKGSATDTEGLLVHEFLHNLLDPDNIWSYASGTPTPAATSEGAARWVEAYFRSSPAAPVKAMSALKILKPVVLGRPNLFKGRVPTDAEIYGSADLANYYYDLAALTFDWEARGGVGFAIQCVVDAYINGSAGPFGGVVTKVSGSTITFADPHTEEAKWASWIRAGMPK